jgi:hypothetical protein
VSHKLEIPCLPAKSGWNYKLINATKG